MNAKNQGKAQRKKRIDAAQNQAVQYLLSNHVRLGFNCREPLGVLDAGGSLDTTLIEAQG